MRYPLHGATPFLSSRHPWVKRRDHLRPKNESDFEAPNTITELGMTL